MQITLILLKKKSKSTFELAGEYYVRLNEFDFPTSVTKNTLLYSLLLQKMETIDVASTLFATAGFLIQSIQGLTQGNQWNKKLNGFISAPQEQR